MNVRFIVSSLFLICCWQAAARGVYERAGWRASLSTRYHSVSGEVTIVDANTIRVDHFYFDGGGPLVYFYLGPSETHDGFSNGGLGIGPKLTGQAHEDETLVINLPSGQTLDGFSAISVWCADFQINFGSGTFGSVVNYKVTFDAAWSAETHLHVPTNPHFSGLIGATHADSFSFWQFGQTASDGMEAMAETGDKTALMDQIDAAQRDGSAYSLISGPGINPSPNSVSTTFPAHSAHPLVSLVAMIAPSPDWFVGVADVPLFENGRWRSKVVVDLVPYDAGTDSGTDFTSPNADTQPHDPISFITGFPFAGDPPLGTFTFSLTCPSPPPGDLNGDYRVDALDLAILSAHWLLDCSQTPDCPECQDSNSTDN